MMSTKLITVLLAILYVAQAEVIDLGVISDSMPCGDIANTQEQNAFQVGDCARAVLLTNARKRAASAPAIDADYSHFSLSRAKDTTGSNVYAFSSVSNNDPQGGTGLACPDGGDVINFSVKLRDTYTVSGSVVDATNLQPIANSFVYLVSDPSYNATTASDGSYVLNGVPNGTYSISFTATGYVADTENIVVTQSVTSDSNLSPTLTGSSFSIRVVVTWGPESDFDSYLWLGDCVLWYANTYCACADGEHQIDCTTGYGPETITALDALGCGVDPVYAINRYDIPVESLVVVKLYTNEGLVGQWSRQSITFAAGGWWRVFSLSDNGGSLEVTTIDEPASSIV